MYNVDIRIDLVDWGVSKDTQIGNEIQKEQHPRIKLVPNKGILGLETTHAWLPAAKAKAAN